MTTQSILGMSVPSVRMAGPRNVEQMSMTHDFGLTAIDKDRKVARLECRDKSLAFSYGGSRIHISSINAVVSKSLSECNHVGDIDAEDDGRFTRG